MNNDSEVLHTLAGHPLEIDLGIQKPKSGVPKNI